ncbi:DUF6230 family protein [Caldibacillus debilis]|nr:DUF6230 family protein [Caldibacillus debilis]
MEMGRDQKLTVGRVWKKKFFIALFTGFFSLFLLIAAFGFTGSALALPLGGIGDFIVEFDELQGSDFELLPHMGETGNADQSPMVRNKMGEAKIKGLHIYKDLKMPTGQWVRFHVRAEGETTIKGLIQDARFIHANLSFEGLSIVEKNTENFAENWTQSAKKITITDAKLITDYLFQSMVSLKGAKISTELIDEPEIIEQ